MSKTLTYQDHIKQCVKWREEATNDAARDVWRKMEAYWRERAASQTTRSEVSVVDSA
jgi:hypothetical protein